MQTKGGSHVAEISLIGALVVAFAGVTIMFVSLVMANRRELAARDEQIARLLADLEKQVQLNTVKQPCALRKVHGNP